MTYKRFLYLMGFGLLLVIAPVAYQIDRAAQSLPAMDGRFALAGLSGEASVDFDALGIPSVRADNRVDAYRVLGYLHGRDRLFQMDILRRKTTGRLAEVLGDKAIGIDRKQRSYRFAVSARTAVEKLPEAEKTVLDAYAAGVNSVVSSQGELPPEFRVLHYRPEPWEPSDSLLVGMAMFQTLSDQERVERMLTVMQSCLPTDVMAFLTPDTDEYNQTLLGGNESRRPALSIPTGSIERLLGTTKAELLKTSLVEPEAPVLGSNNWAVGGSRTADGRAILADDMHLPLAVPNIWYRAQLTYEGHTLSGVTLPGLPLIVAGSNGRVAWGFTNLNADVQDLILLEVNPDNPDEYRTTQGWQPFEKVTETIKVKDGKTETLPTRGTIWGPVMEKELLGKPVAMRWTALDPDAINLRLLDIDSAGTLEIALNTLQHFGTPPQNAVVVDDRGHIGWTTTGFIPLRKGFDGSVSLPWTQTDRNWQGFLKPEQLPQVVDPPEGYLATANSRPVGIGYPHVIGHHFANGYRAYRIRQLLSQKSPLNEQDLHAIQLDTESGFYEFYRQLALELLSPERTAGHAELAEMAAVIREWNGRLDPDSQGIALITAWRAELAKAVFSPLFGKCEKLEPSFSYQWWEMETPLRAMLRGRMPSIASFNQAGSWENLLVSSLLKSAKGLKDQYRVQEFRDLSWQRVNTVRIQHPFSRAQPLAESVLDMAPVPGACNGNCIKVLFDQNGASERLVISPSHPGEGILEMPGGQSGHLLSAHYRDQQPAWEQGTGQAFSPGEAKHRLLLVPAD